MNNLDINKQITEFFKTGAKITKVKEGDRSLPEYLWHRETYPVNYKLKRSSK
jgi:hypothetical protein|tara:strand:- start:90 stop:245 length:156 start_codon:yes stop_codon:yes gene_type:complete